MRKLNTKRLDEFLRGLCVGRRVFALEKDEPVGDSKSRYHLVCADKWDPERHTLGAYRPVEPLKSLVFPPRESVASAEAPSIDERIVIGVKGCDLSALQIHDYVFLETEPVDPFYAEARAKTILVSCDCTDARDVCFCPAVGEQPYAKEGFDINISPTSQGYIVESGTEKGEELLKGLEGLFESGEDLVKERDEKREEMTAAVTGLGEEKGLVPGADLRAAVEKTAESGLWGEFAENCVECGACNFVCCTCHCFLLSDGIARDDSPTRVKEWDSCLYRNFARVAGGANPRGRRAERLYNRFDKKFSFFSEVLGTYACDGCGRCVEACTGKIDIREVLKRALDES